MRAKTISQNPTIIKRLMKVLKQKLFPMITKMETLIMIMDGLQEITKILIIIEEGAGDVEGVKEEEEVEKEIIMVKIEEEISVIIKKKKIVQMIILKYLRMMLKIYLLKVLIMKLLKKISKILLINMVKYPPVQF